MAKGAFIGESNGSAFLPLFAIPGWLGPITSWFLKRAWETEVVLKLGIWELNLYFVLAELTSLGIATSLYVQLTFPGVRKMCAQLHAASVTFTFGSTVRRRLNIYCTTTTSAVINGLVGPMILGWLG